MIKPEISLTKIRRLVAAKLETDLKVIRQRYEREVSKALPVDVNEPFTGPAMIEWRVLTGTIYAIDKMIDELKQTPLEERIELLEQQLKSSQK